MFRFDSFGEFLAMAGHGPFVWWSYGVSLLVLIYLVAGPMIRARRELRAIRREPRRRHRRDGRSPTAGERVP